MAGIPRCPTCRQAWRARTVRRCPRCSEEKPLDAFSRGDGYCKPCRRAYMRRYFQTYRR